MDVDYALAICAGYSSYEHQILVQLLHRDIERQPGQHYTRSAVSAIDEYLAVWVSCREPRKHSSTSRIPYIRKRTINPQVESIEVLKRIASFAMTNIEAC